MYDSKNIKQWKNLSSAFANKIAIIENILWNDNHPPAKAGELYSLNMTQ